MKTPAAPSPSVLDWLVANQDGVLTGALVALGLVALMLVARSIGQRMVASESDAAQIGWRSVVGRVLARTSIAFMVVAAVDMVATYAVPPPRAQHLVDIAFTIAFALQGAIWARELILAMIARRVGENPGESTLGNATSIIRVLVSVALFALAIVVILDNLGINVTALVAGLGIGGIAIGLAAQGIFSDLFAALSIVFDRPFRRGDTIRFGTTTGTVERIGLKTTRIRAVGGEQVIMANTKLLEQELSNLADTKLRRVTIPFSLTYQTAPDTLEALPELLEPLIKPLKGCRFVRALATGFAPSSIDCELVYDQRTNDPDTIARTRSEVLIAVARAFEANQRGFAYPTQTTFTAAPDGKLVMPWAAPPSTK
jgi:small-conductance mechanosensitive channel